MKVYFAGLITLALANATDDEKVPELHHRVSPSFSGMG